LEKINCYYKKSNSLKIQLRKLMLALAPLLERKRNDYSP